VIPVAAKNRPNEVTPDFGRQFSPSARPPDRCASACEPYRDLIEQDWSWTQWQGHLARPGFRSRLSKQLSNGEALRSQAARIRATRAVGIILTAAGEEAQVDYGSGPMVRDPQSGKYRRTRLFVLTLGYSRKSVRLLVWRSSSRVWAELHEQAFVVWADVLA